MSKKIDLKNLFTLLNKIFWNLIELNSNDEQTNEIGENKFSNLSLTIESLVEIEHFFILNENTDGLDSIILESYVKLLTSNSLNPTLFTKTWCQKIQNRRQ